MADETREKRYSTYRIPIVDFRLTESMLVFTWIFCARIVPYLLVEIEAERTILYRRAKCPEVSLKGRRRHGPRRNC